MNIQHFSNQKILEQLGERFTAARLNRDLTQQQLAEKACVGEKTVANLENGSKSVGLLNIIAILRALDMLDQLELFLPEPPPRAAAVIKKGRRTGVPRRRASGKRKKEKDTESSSHWEWKE